MGAGVGRSKESAAERSGEILRPPPGGLEDDRMEAQDRPFAAAQDDKKGRIGGGAFPAKCREGQEAKFLPHE